jgi:hypothetical protein
LRDDREHERNIRVLVGQGDAANTNETSGGFVGYRDGREHTTSHRECDVSAVGLTIFGGGFRVAENKQCKR